jgi:hypothetical protein
VETLKSWSPRRLFMFLVVSKEQYLPTTRTRGLRLIHTNGVHVRFPAFSAASCRETISKSCLVFFFFACDCLFLLFFLEKSHSDNTVYSYDISAGMDFFFQNF